MAVPTRVVARLRISPWTVLSHRNQSAIASIAKINESWMFVANGSFYTHARKSPREEASG